MEEMSYYTTCENCEVESNVVTVLEGVGEYDREGNILYGQDCPNCGQEVEISGWLDEEEE